MTIASFPLRTNTVTHSPDKHSKPFVRKGFFLKKKHRYYSIFDHPKRDVEAKTEELKKNGLLNWCS